MRYATMNPDAQIYTRATLSLPKYRSSATMKQVDEAPNTVRYPSPLFEQTLILQTV